MMKAVFSVGAASCSGAAATRNLGQELYSSCSSKHFLGHGGTRPQRGNSPNDNNNNFSEILSRKDWYLLLDHHLTTSTSSLNQQFVVKILQNQNNPLSSLKFYIWVSNVIPRVAENHLVKRVLSDTLFRKGPIVLSADFIQHITTRFKSHFTQDLVCILLGTWGKLGLPKYCTQVFAQISYFGLQPTTRLYNSLIHALVNSNSLDLAYFKFQQMPTHNCIPDRFTYNILIHGVCKIGIVDEALRLLNHMDGSSGLCTPNVFTYTILIHGFCNANRVDEAFQMLETMKNKNLVPTEATYRSLVHGVFRSLPPREAYEFFSRYIAQGDTLLTKPACDAILCSLLSNSLSREAAELFRLLEDKGYFPDSSTFSILMVRFTKDLDLNQTCNILNDFIQRGGKPGFNVYLTLIKALFKAGMVQEGNQCLDKMVDDGLVASVYSYNMLINVFCQAEMTERAMAALAVMQQGGVPPNLVTFNTLISGYSKVGGITKVKELLKTLLDHGFKPDIITFSSIIDGLCRVYQVEDAFDCFDEMVEWGIIPNAVVYNILIRSLCVSGNIGKSMQLLKKMKANGVAPDIFAFNALILSICKMNKIEDAQSLFDSVLRLGLTPDSYTYSAFIKRMCESGRTDDAMKIFLMMKANGCSPDSYIIRLMVDSLSCSGGLKEAQDLVTQYTENDL